MRKGRGREEERGEERRGEERRGEERRGEEGRKQEEIKGLGEEEVQQRTRG